MDINGIQERLDSRAFKILPFRELVPVVLGVPAGLFAGIGTAEFTGASLFVWIWAFVMPLVMITLWLSDSITDRFDGKLGRLIISRSFSVCSLAALQFFTFGLMCFVLIDSVPRDFQGRFVGNEIVFIWLGIISALIVVLMGQVLVALSWDSLCGTKTKPVLEKITGFFYAFYGLIILGLTGYSVGLLGMSEYSILIYLPAIAYGISYAVLGFSWIQVASRHGTDDEALVRFLSRQGIGHACLGLSLLIAAVFMELATYLTVDSFASIYIMMLMPLAARMR